ncbi:hypothetical protein JMM81_07765 [Bacillus sp. V3B]|uniref:hypothetical protein n=1 Tax=Bacillus sp. V3B TaxID=2804915 RepID=UPI00210C0A5E|nr:hypothetical protein [Bacillus sp. V3B]MCQ6274861.1 hypothetical protein [Bacillus sp. V3B]
MDISVYLEGELIAVIPYHSVVSFRLFCEQIGLQISWDREGKRLDLSDSKQEQIALFSTIDNQHSHEALHSLKQFLSVNGLVTVVENVNQFTSSSNLLIKLDVFENAADKKTFLLIEHHSGIDERLRNLLITELNKENISFQLKEKRNNSTVSSQSLFLKCHLPQNPNLDIYKDQILMCLAKVILRYTNRQRNNFISYLPKVMMENWLKSMTRQDNLPILNKLKQKEISKEKNSESVKKISQHPEKKENSFINAEVFFDYTFLPPQSDSESKEYLVDGNLYIKNTGNEVLLNPVICIKISPVQSASLQGQIIPPRMVSSLAMKSDSGEKGWKYVYEDWRKRVKTDGEYWVTPIQVFQISPGETTGFNFKITIDQPKEKTSIITQGFVYFQEGKKQFRSNNQISFSF